MQNHLILPSLNESDDDIKGIIIGIMVNEGDVIEAGETLLEVETDKVTIEVPAAHSGTIISILVNIDQEVRKGDQVAIIESTFQVNQAKPSVMQTLPVEDTPKVTQANMPISVSEINTNVSASSSARNLNPDHLIYPASPSTRRLARKLGINLGAVTQTDKKSRISTEDVKRHAKRIITQTSDVIKDSANASVSRSLPCLDEFGPTHSEKLSQMALATSTNITYAWSNIPHAWLQQDIDITELENWRRAHKQNGGTLTITVIIAKTIAVAMKLFPQFNCSYDEENRSIVFKDYYDVGIAIDTPKGLIVASLRDVDTKGLETLSTELRELSQKADNRKLSAKDMQGAGITLSNLGSIGLTSIFPIVNWPQVAIIGAAASDEVPRYINDEVCKRRIMKLTLGFDHRVINGADGAKFLVYIKALLEDIRLLMV